MGAGSRPQYLQRDLTQKAWGWIIVNNIVSNNEQAMKSSARTQTESDQAYHALHDRIVRGDLQPKQRLVELELAEQLGVGRAAIRTALDRLAHDGLVVHVRNRGAHVRHIAREEAAEMMEARAVLEGLAAHYAALNANADDIASLRNVTAEMQAWLDAGNLIAYSECNAALHDRVVRLANHATVTRLLEQLQANHVRYEYRMVLLPGRAEDSLKEHRAVVDAIAAHDPALAESAMREHLNYSAKMLRQQASIDQAMASRQTTTSLLQPH